MNPHLYLIFNKVNRYFEEINGNKYLIPTNENKEKIKRYEELWCLIRLITKNSGDYDEKNFENQIQFR